LQAIYPDLLGQLLKSGNPGSLVGPNTKSRE
jgi:hypothetical protein